MNESLAIRKRSRQSNRQSPSPSNRFLRALEPALVEHIEFFQAFIREPAIVGALSPSSRSLARAMIQGFDLQSADTIVEIGPGTGAFTSLIRANLHKKTTFITLELDPINADGLRRRFPDLLVYNDSAERIPYYLALHGKRKADYIVSGLPWASLPLDMQERILRAIMGTLAPSGVLTTFAYLHARWLPKARHFRQSLQNYFARIEESKVVWQNLPPAFVYRCWASRTPSV